MAIELKEDGGKLHILSDSLRVGHIDLFHEGLPFLVLYVPLTLDVVKKIMSKFDER